MATQEEEAPVKKFKGGHKQYACLIDTCNHIARVWSDAREHMRQHGYKGKPVLKASAEKANLINPIPDPMPNEQFRGNLLSPHPPSERELVGVVRAYYDTGKDTFGHRKNVISKAVKPMYGNFAFSAFGFGIFQEFAARHGLEMHISYHKVLRGCVKVHKKRNRKRKRNAMVNA